MSWGPSRRSVLLATANAALLRWQDFSAVRIEQIAKGLTFTEGPAWSKDGYLIFSDTPADRLMKWVPGQDAAVYRTDAHGPSGNAFDSDGRLYTCETRTRRVTRTEKDGKIEVLAEKWEGKRLNAPNDIAVAKNGHAWFTDPAFGDQQDQRELDFYGVYQIPSHGALKLAVKMTTRPNGIALSPNGRILYVADSDRRAVLAYDLERGGEAANERVLIAKIVGVPGGIRVDAQGNLYIAAKGVAIYSPEGRLLRAIEMHDRVSNVGFGGADMKSLFVTGGEALYRVRLAPQGPGNG